MTQDICFGGFEDALLLLTTDFFNPETMPGAFGPLNLLEINLRRIHHAV